MKSSLLVLGLAVCAVTLAVVDQDSGVPTWFRLRADLDSSQARIRQLESETEDLRAQIADLETHPWAVERAIREDLDLTKPGEVLIRFTPAAWSGSK